MPVDRTDQVREEGFYWVKFEAQDNWEVAYYTVLTGTKMCWFRADGGDDWYSDEELEQIDERRLIRDGEEVRNAKTPSL